jgi:hypothetical protein
MKKLLFINYFLVLLVSLGCFILVLIYDNKITNLKQSIERENPGRYSRLYDFLLTPMKRLIQVIFIYDILTSALFLMGNIDKIKSFLRLNTNKIAVQSKSQGGYGGFLIELMLSFFIKLISLIAIVYFNIQSLNQIDTILKLYDDIDEKEYIELKNSKIFLHLLLIVEILIGIFYFTTFLFKCLTLKGKSAGNRLVSKRKDIDNLSYRVLNYGSNLTNS